MESKKGSFGKTTFCSLQRFEGKMHLILVGLQIRNLITLTTEGVAKFSKFQNCRYLYSGAVRYDMDGDFG